MAKLPVLSARKVLKALAKAGFVKVSQRGSHIKLKRTVGDKTWTVIVPNFPELRFGTLASIIRQSGLGKDEFFKLI